MRQTKHINSTFSDWMDEVRHAERYQRYYEREQYRVNDEILIWKLPAFLTNEKGADAMVNEARKYRALILDLRGNPGGRVDMLTKLVGGFLDHDYKVAEIKARKPEPIQMAKTRGNGRFVGNLIVLVDSQSASAAEIFARVVQLEKRGTVIGDISEGAVMESTFHPLKLGLDRAIFYGISITRADVIKPDGASLEHVGVTPDELLLPSAADIANSRDPILSRAVSQAGGKLSPDEAGKLFPAKWPPDVN